MLDQDRRPSALRTVLPFFTYGLSLGDVVEIAVGTGQHKIHSKSGHRTIRFAFSDDRQAHQQHQHLHGALLDAGCLVEYRNGGHYGAIDLGDDAMTMAAISILKPLNDAGDLIWEWADPPLPPA